MLARIETHNEQMRVYITVTHEQAMAQAQQAEAEINAGNYTRSTARRHRLPERQHLDQRHPYLMRLDGEHGLGAGRRRHRLPQAA